MTYCMCLLFEDIKEQQWLLKPLLLLVVSDVYRACASEHVQGQVREYEKRNVIYLQHVACVT